MSLRVVPLTLAQANELVERLHRHHKPVLSHRFSIGAERNGQLVGACIVGRPVARRFDPYRTAEVTRLVTDGSHNACSLLYGAAARVAREMGFDRIQTYILATEPGTSLRAAGWEDEGEAGGGNWNNGVASRRGRALGARRTDQPMEKKRRWARVFRVPAGEAAREAA